VRRICRYLPLLVLLVGSIQLAGAQSLIDPNVGFGAVIDKALTTGIDQNTFLPCSAATVAGTCSTAPTLNSFAVGLGVNLMLWEHFGVGMEAVMQPGKHSYADVPSLGATLQSRVTFYDFNGIYQPVNTKKATLQLIGGFGGTNMKFYLNQSSSSLLGNTNYSQAISSSNHINLHAGVGVQVYLNDHVFIRPQVDIHYVPNFTQFGSNLVEQAMVWVGYTIGDKK
jgi:outer membrane protein W